VSVRGAAFLGIGAMVGAGIFALLGEAGAVAGAAVWLSFLLAGIVAGLLGYTVVKLGVRFPSSGGLIAYLVEGFGSVRLVGIASWLGYLAAIVIVCSMVAVAFGSYASSLFIGEDAASGWDNVFTSAIVVGGCWGSTWSARAWWIGRSRRSSPFCSRCSRCSSA
jgi:amino acid transporter